MAFSATLVADTSDSSFLIADAGGGEVASNVFVRGLPPGSTHVPYATVSTSGSQSAFVRGFIDDEHVRNRPAERPDESQSEFVRGFIDDLV